ncbi:MAG: hypothetical protein ACOYD6_07270 [Limnochordia bacterium]|jgi:hypothetical protein
MYLSLFFTGLTAALLAYGANRLVVGLWGQRAVALLVPAIEELAKTGLAVVMNQPLLGVHIIFGLLEAIYDARKGGQARWSASLASIVGHGFFGLLTFSLARGSLPLAIGAAWLVHALWNSCTLLFE